MRATAIVILIALAACAKEDTTRSQSAKDQVQLMLNMSLYRPRTAQIPNGVGRLVTVKICNAPIPPETFASVDAQIQALIARANTIADYQEIVKSLQAVRQNWHDLERKQQTLSQQSAGTLVEECLTDEQIRARQSRMQQ